MAHLAFFTIPFSGHVNPLLGVMAELAARGHRITCPATAEFTDRVRDTGATPVPYETTTRSAGFESDMRSCTDSEVFTADQFVRILRHTLAETVAVLPRLASAYAEDRPDLVVYDPSGWTGRLLAKRWGVPVVRNVPNFADNEHWSLAHGYSRDDPGHPGLRVIARAIAGLLRRLRVDMTPADLVGTDDCPKIVHLPRAFQYAGDTFDDSYSFVGPCIGGRGFYGEWSPPDTELPLALLSLGSYYSRGPDFFRACAETFRRLPWHLVMVLGNRIDPAGLGSLPANVEVHPFLPQTEVLRRARVFINHGGTGTVMEGLSLGVPQVVIPHIAEQRAVGQRMTELGLGRWLPHTEMGTDRLRAAVTEVARDERVRSSVRWMSEQIAGAGGAVAAADVIEDRLAAER